MNEAHHAYDEFDHNSKYQPLKHGDTVRVFHGFWEMKDAINAAMVGLTGKEYAPRRYSYEADNNPQGLFVTLNLNIAKEFTSRGAIMEFVANASDLQAAVWPGGGYTTQGQMAQYFGHGAPGRAKRRAAYRDAADYARNRAKEDPEFLGHVGQSDDPHLAFQLTTPREYQALFVGHLDPDSITAFWVSDDPEKDGRYTTWTRLSREDFVTAYGANHKPRRRMFAPNEPFDGSEFMRRLTARFREDAVNGMMRNAASEVRRSDHPAYRFIQIFENYLWPKQYVPALRWLMRYFGGEH